MTGLYTSTPSLSQDPFISETTFPALISLYKVAIYIRVSGESQSGDDKVSLPVQERELLEHCKDHKWQVYKVYTDVLSGSLDFENRKGGQELLTDAHAGKFNVVIVWDYDRIGRDREGLAAKLFRHQMRELGIQVFSLNQSHQLKHPEEYKEEPYDDGQILIENIHDWQSASTISKFRHRSMMGKTERAKKGKMLNTPPYGYYLQPLKGADGQIILRKDGRAHYIRAINEEEKPIVLRVYHEYVFEGKSMNEIRDGLNKDNIPTRKGGIWERATVTRILKNPVYYGALFYNRHYRRKNALTGKTRWGNNPQEKWIVVSPDETEHDAIISKELFDKAQEIRIAKLKLGSVAVYSEYLFSGLAICGVCGNKMYKKKVTSEYTRKSDGVTTKSQCNGYECGRWTRFRDTEKNYVSEKDLKEAVLQDLKKFKDNPLVLESFISESNQQEIDYSQERLTVLDNSLAKIDDRYNRLLKAYELGSLTLEKFNQAVEQLTGEQKEMNEERESLQKTVGNNAHKKLNRQDFEIAINNFESIFSNGDIKSQKHFLRSLVESVVVGTNEVTINYLLNE